MLSRKIRTAVAGVSVSVIPFANLLGWYKFEDNLDDESTDFPAQNGVLGYGSGVSYTGGLIGRAITNTTDGTVNLGQAAKWLELAGAGNEYTIMFLGFTLDSRVATDLDHIFGNYTVGSGFFGFAFGASAPGGSNFGNLHYYSNNAGWTNSGLLLPTGTANTFAMSHRDSDNNGYYTIGNVHTDFILSFPDSKLANADTGLFNRGDQAVQQKSNCTCSELLIFNSMLSKSLIDEIAAERLAS